MTLELVQCSTLKASFDTELPKKPLDPKPQYLKGLDAVLRFGILGPQSSRTQSSKKGPAEANSGKCDSNGI